MGRPGPQHYTILVVEDEPEIALSLEFLLRQAGHAVLIARDGAEALGVAATAHPDLIILDVALPGTNGLDVCRRIRAGAAPAAILMLSARGTDEDRRRGLACGADAYLTKPFATQELVATVGRLLAARGAARTS